MRTSQRGTRPFLIAFTVAVAFAALTHAETAKEIYKATGINGGLVVLVGCDGQLTPALRADDRFIVHGLDTDASKVSTLRKELQSKGLYGPVSIARFDGEHLPYVGNTVNLVVAEDLGKLTMAEVMRVLAPMGVAYIRHGGAWKKSVKPRPKDIDEWTHFLHDAGNNTVADDHQVHSPKTLRWVAAPRWCRSHEFPSSVNCVVTSGGRIFTIFDEAPTGVFEKLPQKCRLIARDAFNGKLLWSVPLKKWDKKFGTGRGNRWNIHHTIPRRLVAKDDRVYCTLQFLESPVSILDATSGKILAELEGTTGTDEMVLCNGVLVVLKTTKKSAGATSPVKYTALSNAIAAVDVTTRKLLWNKSDTRVAPYALAAEGDRVVYHNLKELVCLDLRSGEEKWRIEDVAGPMAAGKSILVIKDGVVLHHGRGPTGKEEPAPAKEGKKKRKKGKRKGGGSPKCLTAFSLKDGRRLWQQKANASPISAACTQPMEIQVANGIIWCGDSSTGLDLRTGKPAKTVSIKGLLTPGHHKRCMRGKATVNYVIHNKRGAEFVDLNGKNHMRNDWLRTPCFTGCTPANGMFYVPPSQCFCYPGAKVFGYLAMASDPVKKLEPSSRLEKGPAFGKADAAANTAGDWPMYRQNTLRSGSVKTALPSKLSKKWEISLKSRGTQPVIVGKRLWLAEKDAHSIRCLDAQNGKGIWQFTAGGRIDSVPTVHAGMVLFGCTDGSVYALRAGDGALAWRFHAAPDTRRILSFGQLESVWPVHGSVLVQDGVVYFAAGRSSFLDGGILVYALDAATGKVLHHHVLEGPWPKIGKGKDRPFAMEGALSDLLVADAKKSLYMMRIKFDPQLKRLPVKRESALGELAMGENHLVAAAGFLDDTNFDRIYWMYSQRWPGFYFAQHAPKSGQILVFDESTTYAVKFFFRRQVWSPKFVPEEQGCLLFADDNGNQPGFLEKGKKPGMLEWLPKGRTPDRHKQGGRGSEKGTGYVRHSPEKWQTLLKTRVRAMVLAGDKLILAGPPDKIVKEDPLAAFEGRAGGKLHVVSAKDGKPIHSMDLPSPPAFDGISAAHGLLYMATRDGKLVCFGE